MSVEFDERAGREEFTKRLHAIRELRAEALLHRPATQDRLPFKRRRPIRCIIIDY